MHALCGPLERAYPPCCELSSSLQWFCARQARAELRSFVIFRGSCRVSGDPQAGLQDRIMGDGVEGGPWTEHLTPPTHWLMASVHHQRCKLLGFGVLWVCAPTTFEYVWLLCRHSIVSFQHNIPPGGCFTICSYRNGRVVGLADYRQACFTYNNRFLLQLWCSDASVSTNGLLLPFCRSVST